MTYGWYVNTEFVDKPSNHLSEHLMAQRKILFENIVGQGENAGYQCFPTMFSTLSKILLYQK